MMTLVPRVGFNLYYTRTRPWLSTERDFSGATRTMSKLLLRLTLLLILATSAARAQDPLKVCLLSGSEEYESDRTLSEFQKYLEARYPVRCTLLKAEGFEHLPGLKALDDCDVALFFTRRLTISGEELEAVKRYVLAGKPIVGVRTASHGFQNWLEFDKLVLGDNYQGHYANDKTMRATVVPEAKGHPVVQGVGMIASHGSLYKTEPLAADCHLLMVGKSPEGTQPVAWTREFRGARVFYTSLGAQGDFQNATFLRLLTNALFWASKRDIPAGEKPEQPAPPSHSGRHPSLDASHPRRDLQRLGPVRRGPGLARGADLRGGRGGLRHVGQALVHRRQHAM